MKLGRILVTAGLFLLFMPWWVRGQNIGFLDMHGQTSGTSPNSTNLAGANECPGAGDHWGSTTPSLIYTNAQSQPFNNPFTISGCGSFLGNVGLSIQRTMNTADEFDMSITGGRSALAFSYWWKTDAAASSPDFCDQASIGGGDTSNIQLVATSGHTFGIRLKNGSSENSDDSQITVSPNTWYLFAHANNSGVPGGRHWLMIYDANMNFVGVTSIRASVSGTPNSARWGAVGPCGPLFNGRHSFYSNVVFDRSGTSFPLTFPLPSSKAPWASVIAQNRAADWSQAGVGGGVPSDSWTQCGSTINTPASSFAAITSALAACPPNTYLLLGPGTLSQSTGGITMPTRGDVELRGSTGTVLKWTGSGISCFGASGTCAVSMKSSDGTFPTQPPANIYNWTDLYGQGSRAIFLDKSANIIPGRTLLVLDQDDDGYTGASPTSGCSVDNGGVFNFSDKYQTSPTICGGADDGPDGFTRVHRNQWQIVKALSCATLTNSTFPSEQQAASSTCGGGLGPAVIVTDRPIRQTNWRPSQTPQAWLIQPVENEGIRGITFDLSGSSVQAAIGVTNAANVWIVGNTFVKPVINGVFGTKSVNVEVRDNYCYDAGQNNPNANDPYCFRHNGGDWLIQNNICHHVRECEVADGPSTGDVIAYNFAVNAFSPDDNLGWLCHPHARNDFALYEGNIGPKCVFEETHASHLFNTTFRNAFFGWESCGKGQCGSQPRKDYQTVPLDHYAYQRFNNHFFNVLGTPGIHTIYETATNQSNFTIFIKGAGNSAPTPPIPDDPITSTTMLRWGNWDTVHSSTQFSNLEVPSGLSTFANPVPINNCTNSTPCPESFYLQSKPSWWGNLAYPGIGNDVINGNVGVCSGTPNAIGGYAAVPALSSNQCKTATFPGATLNNAFSNHVSANPAMNCWFQSGGVPDGTNGQISFNASSCYPASTGPLPPTNLRAVPKTIM